MTVLKRLIPSLRKRAAWMMWPHGHGVVRREGVLFLLNLHEWHGKDIIQWGIPEPTQRKYFLDEIRRRGCEVFIDIGANSGIYTIFAALQTNCRTIIAFEPNPRSYDRLRAQLLLNGLTDKVETRMTAVSDHNGRVPFLFEPGGNDCLSRVGEAEEGDSVPAVRLDDAVSFAGRRIAIKIDVEGHELAALEGMKNLLRTNTCLMQVECWRPNAGPFQATMESLGYTLVHRLGDEYYFAIDR